MRNTTAGVQASEGRRNAVGVTIAAQEPPVGAGAGGGGAGRVGQVGETGGAGQAAAAGGKDTELLTTPGQSNSSIYKLFNDKLTKEK